MRNTAKNVMTNYTERKNKKMTYKTIYHFLVLDEIKDGKTVYCLDRKEKQVYCVNELTVNDTVAMINANDTEPDRFEYWIEEKEEKENA